MFLDLTRLWLVQHRQWTRNIGTDIGYEVESEIESEDGSDGGSEVRSDESVVGGG
jgi:hypothetical protein